MEFDAIQRNEGACKQVRLVSRTTEEANEEALQLGRALRNNTVVEKISIFNYNDDEGSEQLVSDITQYFTDVLYFLRHGPSLQHCDLEDLGSAWQSTLHAAGANPAVKEIHALGLNRPVDDLRLEYVEKLELSFSETLSFSESPQPWITDALYTANNLRELSIRVRDIGRGCWVIRVFEHLTSCPQLRSVSIRNTDTRIEQKNGLYGMIYWIAKNCPLLDHLDLFRFYIDAETASLISVPSLSLNDCALQCTPPTSIRHLHVEERIVPTPRFVHLRAPQVTTTRLVQSQFRVLESFSWNGASNANKKSMVQSVLPQAQVLHSLSIQYLDFDGLGALFHSLPQYGTMRQLTVRRVDETARTRFSELSQTLLDGLRGNGSLTSITLHRSFYDRQNLFPETSATSSAMNRYFERNEKLPCVLHNQEVRSLLVPTLLFTALEAPKTGISLVARFLWRYN